MAISKRDPASLLEKTRTALAGSQAKIERLVGERAAKLAETDDLAPIQALDRAIEGERQAAAIHRDRAAILEREARRQDYEKRERARVETIEKKIAPNVARVEAIAREVELALATFSRTFAELDEAARSIAVNWPPEVPRPPSWAYLSVGDATAKVTGALQWGRV